MRIRPPCKIRWPDLKRCPLDFQILETPSTFETPKLHPPFSKGGGFDLCLIYQYEYLAAQKKAVQSSKVSVITNSDTTFICCNFSFYLFSSGILKDFGQLHQNLLSRRTHIMYDWHEMKLCNFKKDQNIIFLKISGGLNPFTPQVNPSMAYAYK